jgi:hypothetical protein
VSALYQASGFRALRTIYKCLERVEGCVLTNPTALFTAHRWPTRSPRDPVLERINRIICCAAAVTDWRLRPPPSTSFVTNISAGSASKRSCLNTLMTSLESLSGCDRISIGAATAIGTPKGLGTSRSDRGPHDRRRRVEMRHLRSVLSTMARPVPSVLVIHVALAEKSPWTLLIVSTPGWPRRASAT